MKRIFQLTHTVRYDECDGDSVLTPTAFLRYMQDIAAQDAEDAQLGGSGFWVVKRTVIEFDAQVRVHSRIVLRTYGIGFARISAQRGYSAHLLGAEEHKPVISARTLWVYLDPQGRPTRLPERTGSIWLPDGPHQQQVEEHFPVPPERAPETTLAVVRFSEVDAMRHLNNASAAELFENAAWEILASRGLHPETTHLECLHYDIEYKASPRFGEALEVQSWLDPQPALDGTWTRYQRIVREGQEMVRAHSQWR